MEFDFDQCREFLFSGLVDALETNEGAVRSFGEDCNGTITGVSFDILPWHRFVALSFRTSSDDFVLLDQKELDVRYSPADWKHYEFIGDGSFDEVREYTGSVYSMSGGTAGQESMHLILLTAADALLDDHVSNLFQSCGFDAGIETDKVQWGKFEYMVLDEDKAFKANYCEMLISNRVTKRLLGRVI